MRFRDRRQAGRELAEALAERQLWEPVVLALPRGGVPVAFEIARFLDAPLDVFVARKVGAPGHTEYGIGAIAEGGGEVANAEALRMLRITDTRWRELVKSEQQELDRRVRHYRGDRPLPDVTAHDIVL